MNRHTKINGFARVIEYYDPKNNGDKPYYMSRMWEGQVKNGEPQGFNRYINGLEDQSFIGYSQRWQEVIYGTCLLFHDQKLQRRGIFKKEKQNEDD